MGEVYRARDTRLDRDVAIKVLPESLAADDERLARFEREARVLSQLEHPNVCRLYDIGKEGDTGFLVMELLDGETLRDRLDRGRLSQTEIERIATEIAEGLEVAHRRGLVHRDLKPGNVMLTATGAKILDFGLARPFKFLDQQAREPDKRWQSAKDVALVLRESWSSSDLHTAKTATRHTRWGLALAAVPLAALAGWFARPAVDPPTPNKVEGTLQLRQQTRLDQDEWAPQISPDGQFFVFSADPDGSGPEGDDIYLQRIGGDRPIRLTNTPARDWAPTFSPDGEQIAFCSLSSGTPFSAAIRPSSRSRSSSSTVFGSSAARCRSTPTGRRSSLTPSRRSRE